jgi:flavodoxin/Pyruvate/2-oxoacid:ferredoxin oxidoreductase delta subunit
MKSIVIYYSQTGNTKIITEAIHSGMSPLAEKCEIAPLREVDTRELPNYELIGLGSPVIGFREPVIITDFINGMPSLKGRYGFSFCTHGTSPGGYIARTVAALRRKGLIITGWNDWYGSVFIPFFSKPYYTDGHPDEVDLKEAKDFGKEIVERSRRISKGEAHLIPRLPRKEKYNRLYGTPPLEVPEEIRKAQEDIRKLRPRLIIEKCKYPKCSICMDNCPTHSINLSESSPISYQTCGPCMLWLCEQLCPTGAIKVDWEPMDKLEDIIKSHYSRLAEPLQTFKDLRRFRSLVSLAEEGQDKPLYKIKQHPRLIIRDGVVRLRR